ncbi:hypothetical protein DXG01_002161 [Tephrocybe rancida]|nr:hypothetical protein DXG01_002161 [Tephrocybe rancida]
MHRVRDLRFSHDCDPHTCILPKIISELTAPAPILESLTLGTCLESPEVNYLPNHVFCTPQIRIIYLSGWMVPATVPSLGSLTELILDKIDGPDGPDFLQVISVLQKSPRLERLILRNAFRYASNNPPQDILHLPRLRSLGIQCNAFWPMSESYSYLSHPTSIVIELSIQFNRSNGITGAIPSLGELATSMSSRAAFRRALINPLTDGLNLAFEELDTDGITRAVLHFPAKASPLPVYINAFCQGLRLPHLQCITIAGLDLPQNIWCSVFGALTFLVTLSICGCNRNLLCALAECLDGVGAMVPSGQGELGFRHLQTLELHEWTFDEENVAIIKSRLDIRAVQGSKVQILRLVGASWLGTDSTAVLEQIRVCAQWVEIDGIYYGDQDMEDSDDDSDSHSMNMETDTTQDQI